MLVVDDNVACARTLGSMLDAWNVRHALVHRGPDALAALRAAKAQGDPFQVALLDMQMPGMTGLALTEEIKADAALSSAALIIMHTVGRRGKQRLLVRGGVSAATSPSPSSSPPFSTPSRTPLRGPRHPVLA